jgi:hypothetical protein
VTEVERLKEENRGLRAEMLRAHEDLEQECGKVAYLTGEIAELRKGLPRTQPRAAAPAARPDRIDGFARAPVRPSPRSIDSSGLMDVGVCCPAARRPLAPTSVRRAVVTGIRPRSRPRD